jgi:hypothetical protein
VAGTGADAADELVVAEPLEGAAVVGVVELEGVVELDGVDPLAVAVEDPVVAVADDAVEVPSPLAPCPRVMPRRST